MMPRHDVGTMEHVLHALNDGSTPPPMYVTPTILQAMQQVSGSFVAREMRIDSSVISLWRKRQRPIPGYRIAAFFGVLYQYTDFNPAPDCPAGTPQIAPSPGYAHVGAVAYTAPAPPVAPPPDQMPIVVEPSEPAGPAPSEAWFDAPQNLRWCTSTHGVAGAAHRRHHHGPVCGWYPGVITRTDPL